MRAKLSPRPALIAAGIGVLLSCPGMATAGQCRARIDRMQARLDGLVAAHVPPPPRTDPATARAVSTVRTSFATAGTRSYGILPSELTANAALQRARLSVTSGDERGCRKALRAARFEIKSVADAR
jgi:hypothetical protein